MVKSETHGVASGGRSGGGRGRPLLAALIATVSAVAAVVVPLASEARAQTPAPPAAPGTQGSSLPAPGAPGAGAPPADAKAASPQSKDFTAPANPTSTARPGEELVDLRTATTKTFAGDHPGEYRTDSYAAAVHYLDAGGHWIDIDTSLGASTGGRRKAKANAFSLAVADDASDGELARVDVDTAHSVSFSLEGAAKAKGRAEGDAVTYSKVKPATDLHLTSRRNGVKDDLVLASPAAPDRFVFPLKLRGLTAAIDASGDVVYTDKGGTERARTPHGFMTDAATGAAGQGAMSTGVSVALLQRGDGRALEVRLDRAWLNDPARVYPVTVDPEIHVAAGGDDTYVMSGFVRDNSYDTELKVGTYDGGAHIGRSYVNFNTDALVGATVSHAELHAAEVWSFNCAVAPDPVYRVTQGWNGRTMTAWPGATVDPNPAAGGTWASGGCPNRLGIWDVTGTAAYWAANPSARFGLSLRAANEGDNNRWKRYASTESGAPPALHVWYNHAPYVPWAVTPANGAHVIGSQTTASAYYADGDGGGGNVLFAVYNASTQLVASSWGSVPCNICQATWTTPVLPDGWYQLATIANDGSAYSPAWSAMQWFFLDTKAPNVPTAAIPASGAYVTSPVAASATYGDVYTWPGQVLFDVITSSGAQGPAVWSATVANGARAAVTLPALAIGDYTLYTMAYDGQYSALSAPQPFHVATAPGAPTGVQATAGALSSLLSWIAPATNGAPITKITFTATDTGGGTPIQATCTDACLSLRSLLFSGLTSGRSYNLTATATNAVGTSATSTPVAGSGLILPLSILLPTQVAAGYFDDGQIRVSWQPPTLQVPALTKYVVRAYLAPRPADGGPPPTGTTPVSTAEATSPASTVVVGGLTNGTRYYATVEAQTVASLISSGPSAASNEITAAGKPSAPGDVSVTGGDSTATLRWSAPDDHGNAIKGYTIKVVPNGQAAFTQDATASPATVGNLKNGTAYTFTVSARNDVGSSADSTPVGVTPAGRPFRPLLVTATAGRRSATVSWQPAPTVNGIPGDNGAPLTSYRIEPSTPCPGCSGLTVSPGATSSVVQGLHPGDSYGFTVYAVNRVGQSDPTPSDGIVTIPPEAPEPPANVRATPGDGRATITWNDSDPNGSTVTLYTVTASPGGATGTAAGGGTTSVEGLSNGTSYTFTVVATNAIGNSAPSAPSNAVTPGAPPGPPSNVRVAFGDRQAGVSWDPANGNGNPITRYTVTTYTGSGRVGVPVVVDGSANSATVGGLDNTTEYFFDVAAGNGAGDGPGVDSSVGSLRDSADVYMNGSLADFLTARGTTENGPGAGPPPFNWSADGCSIYPLGQDRGIQIEGRFHKACLRHDFGYRNYGHGLSLGSNGTTKDWIDSILLRDMQDECGDNFVCGQVAQDVYDAVQQGGAGAFYNG